MSNYFWNGLQHFIVAIIFALLFNKLIKENKLKSIGFLAGLLFTSSAIFFVPLHIPYGPVVDKLYQFIHYPLPDWDILIMGMNWHRFFITHSLIIPLVLVFLLLKKPEYDSLIIGICIGFSSHLIWDGITGSMKTAIIFMPGTWKIAGYMAKTWLVTNGIILFIVGYLKEKDLINGWFSSI